MYFYCKELGYSLFEIILVTTIIAIVSLICIPYYHILMQKQELNSIKPLIQQYLSFAKGQSLILHTSVVICSSENLIQCDRNQWNKGVIIFTDKNKNKRIDLDEQILFKTQHQIKYGNLIWKGSSSSTDVITLQGDTGLPRGAPGSFFYCSLNATDNNQRLYISRMGHVRLEKAIEC